MDNATFHRKNALKKLAGLANCTVASTIYRMLFVCISSRKTIQSQQEKGRGRKFHSLWRKVRIYAKTGAVKRAGTKGLLVWRPFL